MRTAVVKIRLFIAEFSFSCFKTSGRLPAGGVYAKRPICGSLRVHHQIQRCTLLLLIRDTCGEPKSSHIPDQQHRSGAGDRRGRGQEIVDFEVAVSREGHSRVESCSVADVAGPQNRLACTV